MLRGAPRRVCTEVVILVLACAIASGCGGAGVFTREYEYEEELYLSLDGSATLHVYASVASLVALHDAPFNPDPLARVDRNALRMFFGAPNVPVSVSLARRDGRRFVHASVAVDNVRELLQVPPFGWSDYQFSRRGDVVEFRQIVGPAAPRPHAVLNWSGAELVAFRLHLPSEIVCHNAPSGEVERGNILEWQQSLAERLEGKPVDIRVQLEPTSILANTMVLFGVTAAAAVATLAGVIWWISRRSTEDAQPSA
jgi:hypothetical protein